MFALPRSDAHSPVPTLPHRPLPALIHPGNLGTDCANNIVRKALFSPPSLVKLGDEYRDPSSYVSSALAHTCYPGSKIPRLEFSKFLADLGSQACVQAGKSEADLKVVYYPFGGADIRTPFGVFPHATDVFAFGKHSSFGGAHDFDSFFNTAQGIQRVCCGFSEFDTLREMLEMLHDFGRLSGLGPMIASRIMATLGARITGISFFELTDSGEIQLVSDQSRTPWSSGVISFVVPGSTPGQVIEKRFWYLHCDVYDGCFLPENPLPPVSSLELTERDSEVMESRRFRDLLFNAGMICADDKISPDLIGKRDQFLATVRPEFHQQEVAPNLYESLVQSVERARRLGLFFEKMSCQALLVKAAHSMWNSSFSFTETLSVPALTALSYQALLPAIRGDAAVVCDGPEHRYGIDNKSHSFWKAPPYEVPNTSDFKFGYSGGGFGSNIFIGRGSQLKSTMNS